MIIDFISKIFMAIGIICVTAVLVCGVIYLLMLVLGMSL